MTDIPTDSKTMSTEDIELLQKAQLRVEQVCNTIGKLRASIRLQEDKLLSQLAEASQQLEGLSNSLFARYVPEAQHQQYELLPTGEFVRIHQINEGVTPNANRDTRNHQHDRSPSESGHPAGGGA